MTIRIAMAVAPPVLALYHRRLHFRSGPGTYTFHACSEHRDNLAKGDIDMFFGIPEDQVIDSNPEEDYQCDWCREG